MLDRIKLCTHFSRSPRCDRSDPLGLFQYGLLHFGHTSGFSSLLRGTHSCPHRSHRYPSSLIFAISPYSISLQLSYVKCITRWLTIDLLCGIIPEHSKKTTISLRIVSSRALPVAS